MPPNPPTGSDTPSSKPPIFQMPASTPIPPLHPYSTKPQESPASRPAGSAASAGAPAAAGSASSASGVTSSQQQQQQQQTSSGQGSGSSAPTPTSGTSLRPSYATAYPDSRRETSATQSPASQPGSATPQSATHSHSAHSHSGQAHHHHHHHHHFHSHASPYGAGSASGAGARTGREDARPSYGAGASSAAGSAGVRPSEPAKTSSTSTSTSTSLGGGLLGGSRFAHNPFGLFPYRSDLERERDAARERERQARERDAAIARSHASAAQTSPKTSTTLPPSSASSNQGMSRVSLPPSPTASRALPSSASNASTPSQGAKPSVSPHVSAATIPASHRASPITGLYGSGRMTTPQSDIGQTSSAMSSRDDPGRSSHNRAMSGSGTRPESVSSTPGGNAAGSGGASQPGSASRALFGTGPPPLSQPSQRDSSVQRSPVARAGSLTQTASAASASAQAKSSSQQQAASSATAGRSTGFGSGGMYGTGGTYPASRYSTDPRYGLYGSGYGTFGSAWGDRRTQAEKDREKELLKEKERKEKERQDQERYAKERAESEKHLQREREEYEARGREHDYAARERERRAAAAAASQAGPSASTTATTATSAGIAASGSSAAAQAASSRYKYGFGTSFGGSGAAFPQEPPSSVIQQVAPQREPRPYGYKPEPRDYTYTPREKRPRMDAAVEDSAHRRGSMSKSKRKKDDAAAAAAAAGASGDKSKDATSGAAQPPVPTPDFSVLLRTTRREPEVSSLPVDSWLRGYLGDLYRVIARLAYGGTDWSIAKQAALTLGSEGGIVHVRIGGGFLGTGWVLRGEEGFDRGASVSPEALALLAPQLAERKLVGTDVYTDDSDPLLVLVHASWIRWTGKPRTDDQTSFAEIKFRVVPPLLRYTGTKANGIKSRGWGNGHDGFSILVENVARNQVNAKGKKQGAKRKAGIAERNHERGVLFALQQNEAPRSAEEEDLEVLLPMGKKQSHALNRFVVSDVRELVDPDAVYSLWSHKLDMQTAGDTIAYCLELSPDDPSKLRCKHGDRVVANDLSLSDIFWAKDGMVLREKGKQGFLIRAEGYRWEPVDPEHRPLLSDKRPVFETAAPVSVAAKVNGNGGQADEENGDEDMVTDGEDEE